MQSRRSFTTRSRSASPAQTHRTAPSTRRAPHRTRLWTRPAAGRPPRGPRPRPRPRPSARAPPPVARVRAGAASPVQHHAFARRERARPATAARNRTPAGTPRTRPASALHTLRRDAWTRVARGEEAREDEAEDEDEADDAEASREHSPGRAAAGFATAMRTIRARTRPASANDASTVAARRFATTAPATAPPPPARSRFAFGSAPIFPATTEVLVRAVRTVRIHGTRRSRREPVRGTVPRRVASEASAAWTELVGVGPADVEVFVVPLDGECARPARARRATRFASRPRRSTTPLSLELELLARERSSMARAKRLRWRKRAERSRV